MTPGGADPVSRTERRGWLLLAALLLLLIFTTAAIDRREWPGFVGDESTYLMAAESLAWDLDLRYERRDFDRFVSHWGQPPDGLILQSGDHGATLAYGKPFFYPLVLSPFARWSPTRGPFVANALLLAATAWLAARTLRPRLGEASPWWIAAFLFASVTFSYTFWAHADLFLLCLTAIALALVFGAADRWPALRWAVAGGLLAAVAFSRPVYAPLVPAALLALPGRRRLRAVAAFLLGAALLCAAAAAVHQATAGAWTSYGAERGGFYSWTGFPAVDFPPEEWDDAIRRLGNVAWGSWLLEEGESATSAGDRASLWGWNLVYLLVGRHVGLLPYFLPLLLGLLAPPRGRARWALLAAVALSVAAVLLLRPFNFYGGGAAIANRYFLPLYPVFWFLAGRRRSALWAVAATLAAAPFLWPLWMQGACYPKTAELTWKYPSAVAQRWLPYETTQSHLKPSGQEDRLHNGLWIKPLTPRIRSAADGLTLLPGGEGTLLIGRHQPLDRLELRLLPPQSEARPRVRGADSVATGGLGTHLLSLEGPRARHPMWWTPRPFVLYEVTLAFEGTDEPVRFTLRPVGEAREGR